MSPYRIYAPNDFLFYVPISSFARSFGDPLDEQQCHLEELGQAMIRFGLCCMFRDQPIKFVATTANHSLALKCELAIKAFSRKAKESLFRSAE